MLSEITVNKLDLLATLRKNKEKHIEIVKEAQIGYIKKAKDVFEEKLKKIVENGIVDLNLNLTAPVNYSKEYDTAISMLEWERSAEVRLNQQNFKQFVLDDWSWKNTFLVSNASYSSVASGCALDAGLFN